MVLKNTALLLVLLASTIGGNAQTDPRLQFTAPARYFEDALPLGNGRIGAMLYGDPARERILLNEATLWAGGPVTPAADPPDARKLLPRIREALFSEKYALADSLVRGLQGKFSQSFAPLGELRLDFEQMPQTNAYRRELNLRDALAAVDFQTAGGRFRREMFVSAPDQVIVLRLTAKGGARLNFRLGAASKLRYTVKTAPNELALQGHAPIHAEPSYRGDLPNAVRYDAANAMRFLAHTRVARCDGRVALSGDTALFPGPAKCCCWWPLPQVSTVLTKIPVRKAATKGRSRGRNSTRQPAAPTLP